MKKTLLKAAIFVAAAVAAVAATLTLADERVDDIVAGWNRGDSIAIQRHFYHDIDQAMMGSAAEQGGELRLMQHRWTGNGFELVLAVDGRRERWVLTECQGEASTYFCEWRRSGTGVSRAAKSQALDVATTAAGLGLGFAEMNPLGLAVLPLKVGALAHAGTLPREDCVTWRTWLDALGIGAGVANLVTIIAGVASPAIPVAIMAGAAAWRLDGAKAAAEEDCGA